MSATPGCRSSSDRVRLDKAAVNEGLGLRRADQGEWLAYATPSAPVSIRLTRAEQAYVIAVDHPGVAADLAGRWQPWSTGSAPDVPDGFTAFAASDIGPLHRLVPRSGVSRGG